MTGFQRLLALLAGLTSLAILFVPFATTEAGTVAAWDHSPVAAYAVLAPALMLFFRRLLHPGHPLGFAIVGAAIGLSTSTCRRPRPRASGSSSSPPG